MNLTEIQRKAPNEKISCNCKKYLAQILGFLGAATFRNNVEYLAGQMPFDIA
jgi:hypothetical protein